MALQVVGAGLGRTGTNSLMTALEMILPGECHHMYKVFVKGEGEIWRDIGRGKTELLADVMAGYVASVDWPSAAYWEQLATENPDALILLSVRGSGEAWFKSASETIFPGIAGSAEGPWKDMVVELLSTTFTPDYLDKDKAIAAYEAHNDYVRSHADPKRLLEWQATDGWAPICERLGIPVPDEPFPHTNSTEEFNNRGPIDTVTRPNKSLVRRGLKKLRGR
ncbi:MAG: sulfotransferase [Acidimicrobiales bacterium]|nr:sulfotransferase [Acidimicrobiales bacterium]